MHIGLLVPHIILQATKAVWRPGNEATALHQAKDDFSMGGGACQFVVCIHDNLHCKHCV